MNGHGCRCLSPIYVAQDQKNFSFPDYDFRFVADLLPSRNGAHFTNQEERRRPCQEFFSRPQPAEKF